MVAVDHLRLFVRAEMDVGTALMKAIAPFVVSFFLIAIFSYRDSRFHSKRAFKWI
jgi:hypothetical protein